MEVIKRQGGENKITIWLRDRVKTEWKIFTITLSDSMAPCSKRATPYTIGDFILGLSGKGKQDIYSSQPNLLSLPNHKIFKKSDVVLGVYV